MGARIHQENINLPTGSATWKAQTKLGPGVYYIRVSLGEDDSVVKVLVR